MLSAKVSKFSKVSNTSPDVCADTSLFHKSFNFVFETTETEPAMLSTQDLDVLEILEELEGNADASFTGYKHECDIDHSRMNRGRHQNS